MSGCLKLYWLVHLACRLSHRKAQTLPADEVQVQVENSLPGVRPVVDDQAVAVLVHSLLYGNLAGNAK